jgi:hypothetical protein
LSAQSSEPDGGSENLNEAISNGFYPAKSRKTSMEAVEFVGTALNQMPFLKKRPSIIFGRGNGFLSSLQFVLSKSGQSV